MANKQAFTITPLGAAIVEALPDQKKKRAIQAAFNKQKICPASAIFSEAEVIEFYKQRGMAITSRPAGVKVSRPEPRED